VFSQLGIRASRVDMTDPAATEAALTDRTKLIWAETPSNPMLKVVDIRVTADLARDRGVLFAVDNTFATPFLQNPLALGADIVCHSSTKYLGGHSDVIGGVLVVNDDALAERLRYIQNAVGAVPAPWDCFLLLRSTKTLHVRMERHCENARRVAAFLVERPEVRTVAYPGLESHPQHEVAARQMRDFGGMITIVLDGGIDRARRFLESVSVFTLGESLGGVESLIEHPAIMTHASIPPEEREEIGILDGLVRLSVGIEDVEDLVRDLSRALEAV